MTDDPRIRISLPVPPPLSLKSSKRQLDGNNGSEDRHHRRRRKIGDLADQWRHTPPSLTLNRSVGTPILFNNPADARLG
jgi:hypothetical protein